MTATLEDLPLPQVLSMQQTRVFVMGDAILDAYLIGKVSRISPEAPVPVIHETERRWVAGGAANVAANTATFGAQTWLCARIGLDAEGERLIKLCHEMGIQTEAVLRSPSIPTVAKTRLLAGYQQIVRIDNEVCEDLSSDECRRVLKHLDAFLGTPGPKVVVVSDYSKGFLPRELVTAAITSCVRARVPVVTDPKSCDIERYAGSTVIKPNLKDGRDILRTFEPRHHAAGVGEETEAMCDCFLKFGKVRNVVLSLSEKGVLVKGFDTAGPVRLPSRALKVADVSGAGDTMVAFLSLALGAGFSVENAARIGNIASGIACAKPGTATVSLAEFLETLRTSGSTGTSSGILSRDEAANVSEREREAGKKVVFTNGCFDILHAGHIRSLQQARSRGDVLFVGLNSDASIRRLKGPTRPIQTASDRAEILSALSCVDFVVEFDEDTPLDLICAIKPHVLVKGGDYRPETVVGAAEVQSWGGRVEIIPLLEGRSTTSIVKRSGEKT